jgi:hypothetical protein
MLRKMLLAAAVAMVAVSVASAGYALEANKTLTQVNDNMDREPGPWGSQDYCTLTYYNFCAGWVYVWAGWSPSDVVGVEFDPGTCPPKAAECAQLAGAWLYFFDTYPTYGFTAGTGAAKTGDQPGHLGKVTQLSDAHEWYSGWNFADTAGAHVARGGVFFVHFENAGPIGWMSDGSPQACANGCDQTCPSLPSHSYYYGLLSSGSFSGSSFYTGSLFPAANEMVADIVVCCFGPTAIEDSNWGSLKNMFE